MINIAKLNAKFSLLNEHFPHALLWLQQKKSAQELETVLKWKGYVHPITATGREAYHFEFLFLTKLVDR
jgi:hypothetical protein